MKKFLLILSMSLAVGVFAPALAGNTVYASGHNDKDVFSGPCSDGAVKDSTLCKTNKDTKNDNPDSNRIYGPGGILFEAAEILLTVVGIVSVIMIIIGGFKYILSTGDPSKVNSAKNTILYAIVGLAIAVSAQLILLFVINKVL